MNIFNSILMQNQRIGYIFGVESLVLLREEMRHLTTNVKTKQASNSN